MCRTRFMKRLLVCPAAALLTLVIGLYVYLHFTAKPNQFWHSFGGAEVRIGDVPFFEARVYEHPDGRLLINLNQRGGWYAYLPEERDMALCNPIRYVPMPGYIYAHDWHDDEIPCALMTPVKSINPELVTGENFIEFTAVRGGRVRVSW
jgi:hypothetical protein